MADLDFIINNDCTQVTVKTPESLYIEYMSKNLVKDFSDIRKYVISYSQNNNCDNEAQTIDVPPNYQLVLTKANCATIEASILVNYYVQITGINSSLIQEVYFCSGVTCVLFPHQIIDDYNVEILLANSSDTIATIPYYFKIVTIERFEYLLNFNYITTGISCGATFEQTSIEFTLPSIVGTPSTSISLNTLFDEVILPPANYFIQICEIGIDNNPTECCVSHEEFLECCVIEEICDSTDDVCNLTKEIMQKHQSIIYGLQCNTALYNERILKHWIKLYCPSALEPSC